MHDVSTEYYVFLLQCDGQVSTRITSISLYYPPYHIVTAIHMYIMPIDVFYRIIRLPALLNGQATYEKPVEN